MYITEQTTNFTWQTQTDTDTHTHTYINIYMCVCVCVCVWRWFKRFLASSRKKIHSWTFFLRWMHTTSSSSSSLSGRTISTDILDPFSSPFPIVHCFRQVVRATSRIGTELLYVRSSWSSSLCSSIVDPCTWTISYKTRKYIQDLS